MFFHGSSASLQGGLQGSRYLLPITLFLATATIKDIFIHYDNVFFEDY